MKKCTKCQIEKEENEYYKRKDGKDGLYAYCKGCDKIMGDRYRKENSERIKARNAKYRKENPEKIKATQANWAKNNPEKRRSSQARWVRNNPKKLLKHQSKWQKEKIKTDPLFKLKRNLRCRTAQCFSKIRINKPVNTKTLLGAEWVEVKTHIEEQFTEGMTWENHGEWHIDHIIPLASAKYLDEIVPLCHYTNLQPLWAIDNIKKGCKTSLYHQTV